MLRWVFLISLTGFAYLAVDKWESRPITHAPGVLVSSNPVQTATGGSVLRLDDFILTRRAAFEIQARVLSSEAYYFGRESRLSPLDLALGWGVMSDQAVLDQIEISQSGRWYRTRYDLPAPVNEQAIISHSGNMHMIPADQRIEKSLKKLREGQIIRLEGYLVDVDHPSGWHWRTSMRRDDTGAGACEIVLVERLAIQ